MQPFQIIGAEFSLSSSKNSAPNFIFDTPIFVYHSLSYWLVGSTSL